MVVLAVSVLTNPNAAGAKQSAKVLLSRQYVDMTRIRIEGLLAAFPKLMTAGSQHTSIETESVRYLYQPLEQILLVIITNRASNIVEDLECLRLLGCLLSEIVPPSEEQVQQVMASAFDIIFAFDEVISKGHRDQVTVESVMTCLEMVSQEELLHRENEHKKIKDATKAAHQAAKIIKERKKENIFNAERGGMDMRIEDEPVPSYEPKVEIEPERAPAPAAPRGTGMKLKGGKKKDLASELLDEEGVKPASTGAPARPRPTKAAAAAVSTSGRPAVDLKEQIVVKFDNEGNILEAPKVKGSLSLTVPVEAYQLFELQFNKKKLDSRNFVYRPHPNLDKDMFDEDRKLRTKPEKSFPIGQSSQIVRWGLKASEFDIPLTLSVWGDDDNVLVQYELKDEGQVFVNVMIEVPCCGAVPTIDSLDDGEYQMKEDAIMWCIPRIDRSNSQGGMNITWNRPVSVSDLTPLTLEIQCPQPLSGVTVQDITPLGPGAAWYRRRWAIMIGARRSTALGKVATKTPEAFRNIVAYL